MRCPDISADEAGRLMALSDYGLDSRNGLPSLDPIVEIAARQFLVPAAAVNMIGDSEVFFAASVGIGECDMRRDVSFCAHAINQDEVMVVPDARLDPRFHDNPLVTAGMILFYAGVPLKAPSGHALGALCIVDAQPRGELSPAERAGLRDLATLAAERLELRRLEMAAQAGRASLGRHAAVSPDAVIAFDAQSRIIVWNERASALFGHAAEVMIGEPMDRLVARADQPAIRTSVERLVGSGELAGTTTDFTAMRADGTAFDAEFVWIHWEEESSSHFGAVVRDLAGRRDERDQLYRAAHFDSLTGLGSGRLLHGRIEAALAAGAAPALILLDLAGFRAINDWLGHAAGDAILCIAAKRLHKAAPQGAMLARTGGDEFAVLLTGGLDAQAQAAVARALGAALLEPMVLARQALRIACRWGTAAAPASGGTANALIEEARQALAEACRTQCAAS